MVETKDDETIMCVNCEAGFGSPMIIEGVDRLIYSQRYQHGGRTSITCYNKIYLRIRIDLLDLDVKR